MSAKFGQNPISSLGICYLSQLLMDGQGRKSDEDQSQTLTLSLCDSLAKNKKDLIHILCTIHGIISPYQRWKFVVYGI